jgi:K+-transporting ATPase KdpF subunit
MLPFHESLRENLEDEPMSMMIYLTVVVAAFLFVYLLVALIRPEWF